MGCSNYRWRTELKNYCQDAAGGGKQQISLSSRRLDLDADTDTLGLLMRLFSSWVAYPPGGWNGSGWIVYFCKGESKSKANPLHCFPPCYCSNQQDLLFQDTKTHRPRPASMWRALLCIACPSLAGDVASCSHHGLGTALATFLTLHQTIPNDSSRSPKWEYFPWALSASFPKLRLCQLFISSSFPIPQLSLCPWQGLSNKSTWWR